PLTVAIRFEIKYPYHLYWTNPEGAGFAPSVTWKLPEGFEVTDQRWPAPEDFSFVGQQQFGYERELTMLFDLAVPDEIAADGKVTLSAELSWLACGEGSCIPEDANVSIELPIQTIEPRPSDNRDLIIAAEQSVPRPVEGWSFSGEQTDGGFNLFIQAPSEQAAQSLKGLRYYHDVQYSHDSNAEQAAQIDGATIRLYLTDRTTDPDSFAEPPEPFIRDQPLTRLTGILVSKSGFGDPTHTAVPIDVAIQNIDAATQGAGLSPDSSGSDQTDTTTTAQEAELGFVVALVFAFIGGLILNLMPCVFPVLSIKILGFVNQAGENPSIVRRHGYAFGAGVLVSFWVLVGVLLTLRAAADAASEGGASSVSWGFQLQNPNFVLAMLVLVFVIGLNLIGAFEMGVGLSAAAGRASQSVQKEGYGKSFFTGVLATLIATPCTGPFMAPAIGQALTMPSFQAFIVFTALGAGMAMPYVVLSCFPKLLNYLPRPGAWMESFKQAMAFPMFATAGWLAWGYVQTTGVDMVVWLLIGLTVIAMGAWAYGRWSTPIRIPRTRWLARIFAISAVIVGVWMVYGKAAAIEQEKQEIAEAKARGEYVYEWLDYSPERVEQLRGQGKPIVIDFTAWWCQICQTNKATTLRTDKAKALYEKHEVILIEADYGQRDPVIGKILAEYNRAGVPLYLVFPADGGEPEVLPETLAPSILEAAVERAAISTSDDTTASAIP
ncbi:MAG: protein-disulfide reductase DsbD domain-containing protein, partial [Planctomycetota bacterium]